MLSGAEGRVLTSATFLHIVGSELIQKCSGDGSKLVRELFHLAFIHPNTTRCSLYPLYPPGTDVNLDMTKHRGLEIQDDLDVLITPSVCAPFIKVCLRARRPRCRRGCASTSSPLFACCCCCCRRYIDLDINVPESNLISQYGYACIRFHRDAPQIARRRDVAVLRHALTNVESLSEMLGQANESAQRRLVGCWEIMMERDACLPTLLAQAAEALAALHPTRRTISVLQPVASFLVDLWLHQAAIDILRACRQLAEHVDADDTELLARIARLLAYSYCALIKLGPCTDALAEYEQLVRGTPKAVLEKSMRSELATGLSRLEEAWKLTQQVLDVRLCDLEPEDTIECLHRAGRVANACCQFEVASACAQAALDVAARMHGKTSFRYAVILITMSNVLISRDKISAVRGLICAAHVTHLQCHATARECLAVLDQWFGANNLLRAELCERIAYWSDPHAAPPSNSHAACMCGTTAHGGTRRRCNTLTMPSAFGKRCCRPATCSPSMPNACAPSFSRSSPSLSGSSSASSCWTQRC